MAVRHSWNGVSLEDDDRLKIYKKILNSVRLIVQLIGWVQLVSVCSLPLNAALFLKGEDQLRTATALVVWMGGLWFNMLWLAVLVVSYRRVAAPLGLYDSKALRHEMKCSESETRVKQKTSFKSESMSRYQLAGFKRTICIVFLFFKMAVELNLVFIVLSKQTKKGYSSNQLHQTQISPRAFILCGTIPLILVGLSEFCLLPIIIFFTSTIDVFSRPELRCILEYCQSVLSTCMCNGVWNVKIDDDEEFFLIAFTMLGGLIREGVKSAATVMRENYKPLIQYMYAHKRGLEFVQAYMDASGNIYVQLAAVTILNTWADTDLWAGASHAQPELELPRVLLWKLLDKAQSDSLVRKAARKALKAQLGTWIIPIKWWEIMLSNRDTTVPKGEQNLIRIPIFECSLKDFKTFNYSSICYQIHNSRKERVRWLKDATVSGRARLQAIRLPTKDWIFAIPSDYIAPPIKEYSDVEEKTDITSPIALRVTLERSPPRKIRVHVYVHATSTAKKLVASSSPVPALEFYFSHYLDMADCVGVAVNHAKATLYDDLSIIVKQEPDYYSQFIKLQEKVECLSILDESRHLVMRVAKEEYVHAQASAASTAQAHDSNLSQFGVGFEPPSLYVVETQLPTTRSKKANAESQATRASGSWPLLYEMALFILTECQAHKCYSKADAQSPSERGTGFSVIGNTIKKLMGRLTKNDGNNVSNRRNREQGAGGDDDENISDSNPDPGLDLAEFKVTVLTEPSKSVFDPILQEQCLILYGLHLQSICAKIVFKFRKGGMDRSLCIAAHPLLQLESGIEFPGDRDFFGWYHNNIKISFGCDAEDERRASAWLEADSCKVLSKITDSKLTTVRLATSTRRTTSTASVGGCISALGMASLEGSENGSQMQQEAANAGQNSELPFESICGGFQFQNCSGTAYVKFNLRFPLTMLNKWNDGDRESLFGKGLLSTITPALEGTWRPTQYAGTSSHFFFHVERLLQLDKRSTADGAPRREDIVSTSDDVNFNRPYTQLYELPFYVNDAMTHLTNGEETLQGNQAVVDHVLAVASVNVPLPTAAV